jgi:inosose dehydratase
MVGTEAGLCFDPAHLLMVGADPLEVLELAEGRIRHVRLNDVDATLALEVRDGKLDYAQAVAEGLFKPMGTGDARVESVIETLRKSGYRGWYAIDQDVRLTAKDEKPLSSVKRSLEYVRRQAAA